MADRILSRLVRQGGGKLLNLAVDRALPVGTPAKSSLLSGIAGAALIRVATRSVPGAIVVGGGLLAKRLYDKRREKKVGKAPVTQGDA